MVKIWSEIINFLVFFAQNKLKITQNKNLPNFFKNLPKQTKFAKSP